MSPVPIAPAGDEVPKSNLSAFVQPQFSVEEFTSKLLTSAKSVEEHVADLNTTMSDLDRQLREQIRSHHGDLLLHATSVESAENILGVLTEHIHILHATMERIMTRMDTVYNKAETRTRQLERLHNVSNAVRAIGRVLTLTSRLDALEKSSSGAAGSELRFTPKDLVKVPSVLQDLKLTIEEEDLSGIYVVKDQIKRLDRLTDAVLSQSREILERGFSAPNHASVSLALQVFHSLELLGSEMHEWKKSWIASLIKVLMSVSARETRSHSPTPSSKSSQSTTTSGGKNLGRSTLTPVSSTANIRANLWSNVESFSDELLKILGRCQVLTEVMYRKRTESGGGGSGSMVETFAIDYSLAEWCTELWEAIARRVKECIDTELNTHAKSMLENEYPKWLRQMEFFMNKLGSAAFFDQPDAVFMMRPLAGGQEPSPKAIAASNALRSAFLTLENAYLAKSMARVFDCINLAFSETLDFPSKEEIVEIVRTMTDELHAVKFDRILFSRVLRNVVKAINLFNVKSEGLLITDGEASQVVDKPNGSQKKNARVINQLDFFRDSIVTALSAFENLVVSSELLADAYSTADGARAVMVSGLEPITESFVGAISAIVTSMHQEDFGTRDSDSTTRQCSLFMRELQHFVQRTVEEHFTSLFTERCRDSIILSHTTEIARQTAEIFIHHSVLVRPLSESGKLRLASDYAQMELALSPLCRTVADMGSSYELLRDMRPLFFQSPKEIGDNALVGSKIPTSLVLHLLISLSPLSLLSPHESAEWSLSRYSEWLMAHRDERDRLAFLKGTVEAYVKSVHSTGGAEFAETYPIIIHLMKRAMSQTD